MQVDFLSVEIVVFYIQTMFSLWGSSWLYLVYCFWLIWTFSVYCIFNIKLCIQQQAWKQIKFLVLELLLKMTKCSQECESFRALLLRWGFQCLVSCELALTWALLMLYRIRAFIGQSYLGSYLKTTESETNTWDSRGKLHLFEDCSYLAPTSN